MERVERGKGRVGSRGWWEGDKIWCESVGCINEECEVIERTYGDVIEGEVECMDFGEVSSNGVVVMSEEVWAERERE